MPNDWTTTSSSVLPSDSYSEADPTTISYHNLDRQIEGGNVNKVCGAVLAGTVFTASLLSPSIVFSERDLASFAFIDYVSELPNTVSSSYRDDNDYPGIAFEGFVPIKVTRMNTRIKNVKRHTPQFMG